MKLFTYLFVASVLLAVAGIAFIKDDTAAGVVLAFIAVAALVHARCRWPADQDYYLGRNFTRNRDG